MLLLPPLLLHMPDCCCRRLPRHASLHGSAAAAAVVSATAAASTPAEPDRWSNKSVSDLTACLTKISQHALHTVMDGSQAASSTGTQPTRPFWQFQTSVPTSQDLNSNHNNSNCTSIGFHVTVWQRKRTAAGRLVGHCLQLPLSAVAGGHLIVVCSHHGAFQQHTFGISMLMQVLERS
jgi:hypothetical protein